MLPTSQAERLEQNLFGYSREAFDPGILKSELVQKQNRIIEILELLDKAGDHAGNYIVDPEKIASIVQQKYPFVKDMQYDPGTETLTISVTGMPVHYAFSNSPLAEEWHGGTIFTTGPGYYFEIKLRLSPSQGNRVHFKNTTPALQGNSRVRRTYEPRQSSVSQMGHPHGGRDGRSFSDLCAGTNTFYRRITENQIHTPEDLYHVLNYMFLWLETANATDWFGRPICESFRSLAPGISAQHGDSTGPARFVASIFSEINVYISTLLNLPARELANRITGGDFERKILRWKKEIEESEYCNVESSDGLRHNVELAELRSFLVFLVECLFNGSICRVHLITLHDLAYKSFLVALYNTNRDAYMPRNMRSGICLHMLLRDLMRNSGAQWGTQYSWNEILHVGWADRLLAGPYVFKQAITNYHRPESSLPSWITDALPDTYTKLKEND